MGAGDFLCHPPQLEELSGGEAEQGAEQEAAARGQRRSLRFGCMLQLSFPRHGCTTRAAAVVEDRFTCTGVSFCLLCVCVSTCRAFLPPPVCVCGVQDQRSFYTSGVVSSGWRGSKPWFGPLLPSYWSF